MKEYIRKFLSIFRSPAAVDLARWSKCIHASILLICILNACNAGCSLCVTLATKGLIDGAVSSHAGALWRYGLVLVLLILLQRILTVATSLVRTISSSKLQRSLQSMLTEGILSKEYARLKGYHSGELVNRVFSDVHVIRDGIMNILPNLISMTVGFVGAAAILISMDWRFVILLVVGGIFGLAIIVLFKGPMKARHRRMQEAEGALHASTQETLENIRLIKASVSEERAARQIGLRRDRLQGEQVRQGRFSAAMNNSLGLVFNLSWLFCMLWGCVNIYHGRMTYGSLAAMIQLIGRIQSPIASAAGLAAQTYGVISSGERLQELMNLPAEIEGEALDDFDSIRLDHVSFRYDDGIEDVLQDISCTVRRGDFVALTGISGGGKTSLFQLLLGIYKPTKGQVLFCRSGQPQKPGKESAGKTGTNADTVFAACTPADNNTAAIPVSVSAKNKNVGCTSADGNADSNTGTNENSNAGSTTSTETAEVCVPATRGTRHLFAYVPQGNTLFSGTLYDNLTMFTDKADRDEIMAAARAACIDTLVDEIGLGAVLGERGIGLSEGQAQRVAIARALLSKAPILLLDESTSALDEETEAKLLANISTMRDKTCFIVTHRRAALAICDYRLHIKDGEMMKQR